MFYLHWLNFLSTFPGDTAAVLPGSFFKEDCHHAVWCVKTVHKRKILILSGIMLGAFKCALLFKTVPVDSFLK
jgi:hypothetical protein